ncbi:MAG: hypothetical protein QW343_01670 [Candidatus Norongarragalinales archaeon]
MNYWWVIALLALLLSDDLRYGITAFLNGLDTWILFVLFILALAWWNKSN